jgi:hypothetical protein
MITRDHPIDVLFVDRAAFVAARYRRARRGISAGQSASPDPRAATAGSAFAAPNKMQDTSVGLSIAGPEPLPEEFCATTWVVVVGQPTEHLGDGTPAKAVTARWLNRLLADSLLRNPEHIAW